MSSFEIKLIVSDLLLNYTLKRDDNDHGRRNSIDLTFCYRIALINGAKQCKTSFSRRAITACSWSFFILIPPNFASHTCYMISAILYSFVYYNFVHTAAHQSNMDDRYLLSIIGQPIKILRHQSAGCSNRYMKPVQSLFSLIFQWPR